METRTHTNKWIISKMQSDLDIVSLFLLHRIPITRHTKRCGPLWSGIRMCSARTTTPAWSEWGAQMADTPSSLNLPTTNTSVIENHVSFLPNISNRLPMSPPLPFYSAWYTIIPFSSIYLTYLSPICYVAAVHFPFSSFSTCSQCQVENDIGALLIGNTMKVGANLNTQGYGIGMPLDSDLK